MHKEPRSGFGKRLDLIVEPILAGGEPANTPA
jgi:hypothetical protein